MSAAPLTDDQINALDRKGLAQLIDHTLLTPTATGEDITEAARVAADNGVASLCIQPVWVPTAATYLQGSPVAVCTVIGFPHGATSSYAKAYEAEQAVRAGATEVDMVIQQGAVADQEFNWAVEDIKQVVAAAKLANEQALVKVILETSNMVDAQGNLNEVAVRFGCEAAEAAGADFVKTSTGFAGGGATVDAVRLMRETVGDRLGVKASGGIRNREAAIAMLQAGATRIGASSSLAILDA